MVRVTKIPKTWVLPQSSDSKQYWRTDRARAVPVTADGIHKAIAKVCPINGVSIGTWADKATWVVTYREDATEEQRAKAVKLLDSIEVKALTVGHQPFRKIY